VTIGFVRTEHLHLLISNSAKQSQQSQPPWAVSAHVGRAAAIVYTHQSIAI